MPAIITEYGYMDSSDYINFDTREELISEGNQIAEGILKYIGVNDIKFEYPKIADKHFAQDDFDELRASGIVIHEARLCDNITRGEMFVLMNRLRKKMGG